LPVERAKARAGATQDVVFPVANSGDEIVTISPVPACGGGLFHQAGRFVR